MFRPVLVTPPAVVLLTLAEAKAAARVDGDEENDFLAALIGAAIARMDGWTGLLGRCLVNQAWRQDFECWPGSGDLRLPFPDVSAVTVKYSDEADAEQTVAASLYELLQDAEGSFVRFRSGFNAPGLHDDRSDPVRVALTAGYGDAAANVPQAIRTAALMLVAHWHAQRESVGAAMQEIPETTNALLAPYRRRRL